MIYFRLDSAISGLTNLALRSKIRDDDGIDQLHHFVTVTIFAFFGAIAGFKEYASEPINCWNYGEYLWQHFQAHVNTYCWSHSMYQYPNKTDRDTMPYLLTTSGAADPNRDLENENLKEITYYRWVTVVFLAQAFLFKLPNLVWSEGNSYSGSNIVKMVEMLQSVLFATAAEKKEKLNQVALFLEQWLRINRKTRWFSKVNVSAAVKKTLSCCMLCVGNNMDNYLSTLYLIVKGLYLLNVLAQFLIISAFLQLNFWHFGVETLNAYSDPNILSATTSTFPTVALCHFQTYNKGNATGKWVQCILTINLFLEKLFLIEWFWLLLLLVITIINCFLWGFRLLQTQTAIKFVQRYMRLMGFYAKPIPAPRTCSVEQFVTEYLRNDGVFVLRILAVNTNEVVVAELVEELWIRYIKLQKTEAGRPESVELAEVETPFHAGDDGKPIPEAEPATV
ncbi:hypothetical protein BaRGS_00009606 [Batillaria attramentaria]|uniref:Innexin n=1 Tax=Batillaria attramentaria TaxID=370345 RepID=A0ABD0LJA5_9CAEN